MSTTLTLGGIAQSSRRLGGVLKEDLSWGDWVAVRTRNSWYTLFCLGDGRFLASGGWFEQHGLSPAEVTIAGCTWGGRAIWTDVAACPGLFLEFGNGVSTTRIREVLVVRAGSLTAPRAN